MQRQRQSIIRASLAVVGLVILSLPAQVRAITRTPIAFAVAITDFSAGKEWVTPNTVHSTGQGIAGIVSGDLVGTITGVVDTHLNVANQAVGFTGIQLRGTFTIASDTISWSGTVTDAGPNGRGINLVVAHGTDGSKIFGRIFGQPDGTFLIEGTLVEP